MLKVKVENMESTKGRKVPNQFIIKTDVDELSGNCNEYFQSYDTVIVFRERFEADKPNRQVYLDKDAWDYSRTTSKYRNLFLGETTKEIKAKIESGEYLLVDLN